MIQGHVEIVEDKRFMGLKRWMAAKTGWTVGEYSKSAILVLTPEKKATRRLSS